MKDFYAFLQYSIYFVDHESHTLLENFVIDQCCPAFSPFATCGDKLLWQQKLFPEADL
jgi:hypothetical protein